MNFSDALVELLDAPDGTTPDPVSDRIVIRHPLQPFDVRNVTRGALGMPADTPFTFDPTALTAAEAASADRGPEPGFLSGPVTAPVAADVALSAAAKSEVAAANSDSAGGGASS